MYNERSTTGGFSFSSDKGFVSTYGKTATPQPKQISYFVDEETVSRRLAELPGNDDHYKSTYGLTKRQYLSYLLAEDFTLQLYYATEQEMNQEPFDYNALLD